MLRTPIPVNEITQMEKYSPEQLLGIFESSLKTRSKTIEYGLLYDAWATLFSKLYLTPEDLIDRMESGEHELSEDNERMLREFIREDCAGRGIFVLNVIKKGGMIDRAALIMIADLADIAGIRQDGITALHMLITACDKRVRPALIRKAGKNLLSSVYDDNNLPALFVFFSLSDISPSDLDTIEKLFSEDDLKTVISKKGWGRNALQIISELSPVVRQNAARERNAFEIPTGIRTTDPGKAAGGQAVTTVYRKGDTIPPAKAAAGREGEEDTGSRTGTPAPATPVKPALPGAAGRKMKVMIVDDDEIIRNLLQLRLQLLGFEDCIMADSGEDSIVLNEKEKPDIIFMDVMMPGRMDGITAAREIRSRSDPRIIFVTAHTDQEILDRAKETEPAGFIVKPFRDMDLRVALNFLK